MTIHTLTYGYKENNHFSRDFCFKVGWGCGYVGVEKGHPWFKKSYDDLQDVHVHGGLTFSDHRDGDESIWWLGFDTAHYGDNLTEQDENYVKNEVQTLLGLAEQAAK
jgi:hypothetical protein